MSELIFKYLRDDEPNLCGPLKIRVASNGFEVTWDTYVQEHWLADFGAGLRAYPLPISGIERQLTYGEDEVFAAMFAPQGSLGAITVTIKVADMIAGLSQKAELSLTTDYNSVDQFSRSLLAIAKAGAGEAAIRS